MLLPLRRNNPRPRVSAVGIAPARLALLVLSTFATATLPPSTTPSPAPTSGTFATATLAPRPWSSWNVSVIPPSPPPLPVLSSATLRRELEVATTSGTCQTIASTTSSDYWVTLCQLSNPLFSTPGSFITFSGEWKDQGWGPYRKGQIALYQVEPPLHLYRVPYYAPTSYAAFSETYQLGGGAEMKDVEFKYNVGGGGGHELHIINFEWSWSPPSPPPALPPTPPEPPGPPCAPPSPPATPPEPPSPPAPPTSPPEPPSQPPPRAGDDPIFVGADGLHYEVRGEAGRAFNIMSSPSVSVNAEFKQVLPGFEAEDITDTVMGDVEVATCGHFGAAKLFMNASDGGLRLSFHPRPIPAAHASLSMEKKMAASGVNLIDERYICNLRRMTCEWIASGRLPITVVAPQVDMRYSRVKVRHADIQVEVTRNAMVNLGGTNGVPLSELDCTDFSEWEMAEKACKAVQHGTAPPHKRQEWLLILVMTTLPSEQQFHFTQIEIPFVGHSQSQVHGLLGLRAVKPAFTRTIDPAARVAAAAREALFNDRSPTGSFGAQGFRGDPAVGPGVGRMSASNTAELFGPQGEGAIEGHYSDYIVASLSEHDNFKYSRFVCAGGRGEYAYETIVL